MYTTKSLGPWLACFWNKRENTVTLPADFILAAIFPLCVSVPQHCLVHPEGVFRHVLPSPFP